MVANKPIDRSKGGGTADRRGLIKYELLEKLFLIPLYILFYYHRCTAHGPTRMGAFIDQRCCRCLCCGQSGQQFVPKGALWSSIRYLTCSCLPMYCLAAYPFLCALHRHARQCCKCNKWPLLHPFAIYARGMRRAQATIDALTYIDRC